MEASAKAGGASAAAATQVDAIVVGAGFGGMYMLNEFLKLGLSVQGFEAGSDVGGTWYWNAYPGARCDVPSLEYSFTFSKDIDAAWKWTERFAAQPEILSYAQFIADKMDLRRHIAFDTRVTSADFDEASGRWQVVTERGDTYSAHFLVMATGVLSAPRLPDYPGVETYKGATYHTGAFPHEGVDFSGLRVAVMGTGSSAVQAIPLIARQAKQLTVLQRTPAYCIPANNVAMDMDFQEEWKKNYDKHRQKAWGTRTAIALDWPAEKKALEATEEERNRKFDLAWGSGNFANFLGAYTDIITNEDANKTAADYIRGKIRSIVKDAETARKLSPKYLFGGKRPCLDTGYYDTYNRDNVSLVDLRETPIERFTEKGVMIGGVEHEFDAILFATGYDAITGSISKVDIHGRDGVALRDRWVDGPLNYLGLTVAGFPNFFMVTGPGSPSLLANMAFSIEQHAKWIVNCVKAMRDKGYATIEPTAEAERDWVAHVSEVARGTVYEKVESYRNGANIPGKPRVMMPYVGGFTVYCAKCDQVAANNYEGFRLSA